MNGHLIMSRQSINMPLDGSAHVTAVIRKSSLQMFLSVEKRRAADACINRLLTHMQKYGSEKAAMAVKMTITLDDESEGLVPKFEHKVTTTVQRKDDVSGSLAGEYVLEEDGKGGYMLKTLIDQASMFESAE